MYHPIAHTGYRNLPTLIVTNSKFPVVPVVVSARVQVMPKFVEVLLEIILKSVQFICSFLPFLKSNQLCQIFFKLKSMDSLPIINKTYDVYKEIIILQSKLEKRWRYSLGSGLENSILDCMESLIMAKNAPKILKAGYLIKASSKLEVSTLKLRLLLELALVSETKIFQLQAKLSEIGRMLGGWLKAVQSL